MSWDVTRVLFRARKSGAAGGSTYVQFRMPDDSGKPVDAVLAQDTMWEAALPTSYGWQEFTFSDVTGLEPTDAVCLVLKWVSGGGSCEVEWDNKSGGGNKPFRRSRNRRDAA